MQQLRRVQTVTGTISSNTKAAALKLGRNRTDKGKIITI